MGGQGSPHPGAALEGVFQQLGHAGGTARFRELLGMGHGARGAWAGLSHELISFETLNPPRASFLSLPTVPGLIHRAGTPNLLFQRRVRAREPPPGLS